MPTVLGLLDELLPVGVAVADALFVAVTRTVLGPNDDVDVLVDPDPDELDVTDDGSKLAILFLVVPVNSTHQKLFPPQFALS